MMKITTFALTFFLSVSTLIAQNFNGKAVYEVATSNTIVFTAPEGMSPENAKLINDKLNKPVVETYFLNFTKFESVYEMEQKLASPTLHNAASPFGGTAGQKLYKNLKEKTLLFEDDFMGKEFLVSDALVDWNWQLTSETKKIGDYNCYKAVSVIPVSAEEMQEYEKLKKQNEAQQTSFITMSEPEPLTTIAWYTTEIPISQGPAGYYGLPGLILEVQEKSKVILCSKVSLNSASKFAINKPKKGRKVTQNEYDTIVNDKLESMKDSNGAIQISR